MKLLKLALLPMITAAYGLRSYANALRNATAADSPALTARTSLHRIGGSGLGTRLLRRLVAASRPSAASPLNRRRRLALKPSAYPARTSRFR